jgi:hypothetical protein
MKTTVPRVRTKSITDFLMVQADDEANDRLYEIAKLHVPADCGRHCDGHRDESPVWPCLELRVVVAAYSDHPDYNPDWRL